MSSERNSPPASIWDALRRLYRCNKTELAERLGVTARTLHRWEHGENRRDAEAKASDLLIATLRAADNADELAQWPLRERRERPE